MEVKKEHGKVNKEEIEREENRKKNFQRKSKLEEPYSTDLASE
jgi:hypothetical protein